MARSRPPVEPDVDHVLSVWRELDLLARPLDWGAIDRRPPHAYTHLVITSIENRVERATQSEDGTNGTQTTLSEASP